MLTQERLKQLLSYDPETGVFMRLISVRGMRKQLGSQHNNGYWQVCVDYKIYLAHRLAWLFMYGEFPHDQLDHINGDRLDNRVCNLRLVTNKQNHENLKLHKNNMSGWRGVHFCNREGKWIARVVHNQTTFYAGSYFSREDAAEAAKKLRDDLFTHHHTSYAA